MLTTKEQNLIKCANNFNITDKSELEDLLAQCNHESANFTRTVESFNYTPAGLMAIWSKRFTPELANKLGRTPEHPANQQAIANHVYNRKDMGNIVTPNDGWLFRGRGYLQCTGRYNYTLLNAWLKASGYNYDIIANPDIVATTLASISAIWFWTANKTGKLALNDDVVSVSKKINGGLIGLNDRKQLTDYYRQQLN
jgi:putative chitinase